jgi:SPP1 gp7 family putative phage head morphogenesis protein
LAAEDYPDTSGIESAFEKAMKWLHGKRIFGAGMLGEKPVRRLIEETAVYLSKGIERGIVEEQPSEAMVSSLRESAGVFSGFKTFHEMKEAAGLLLDEKGGLKPFEQFSNDVQKINDAYNKHYLKTEYNFTVQSAQMAARWEDQQDDGGGRYLLQYRTAGDKKVRKAHQELEGITLPASDPFWDKYYPPNGFNCRCTVQKVRAAKYSATDGKEAMEAGDKATESKYAEMFRFNPGKQRAAYPAYNSYTVKKCATCKKNGLKLAKIPSNELCAACPIIRECAGDIAKSQAAIERKHYLREMQPLLKKKVTLEMDGVKRNIGFRKEGNKHLYSDSFGRSSALRREHLATLDKVLAESTYVKSSDSLSHERKDDIRRFHYFEGKIDGKTVYLNVAELTGIDEKGKVKVKYFLYSITDRIR